MAEEKINGETLAPAADSEVRIVTIEDVHNFIKPRLEEIQKFLPPFMRVTFFARNMAEEGKDFYLGADELPAVIDALTGIIRKRAFMNKPN